MIKLIAFDWNGTLLADTRLAAEADNYAIGSYIKQPVTIKIMREHFHVPIINYIIALGIDKKIYADDGKKINQRFNKYYEARVNRIRTRSGVRSSLKFLADNKIQAVIYSNHVTSYVIKKLKRLKIENYFQAVLARPDDDYSHMHQRGKAQKLADYIKKCKFKPHEVISVGDTEEEIEIGKEPGYHTVAITGGYNTTARLKKHHPDYLIHNMLELKKIVKKLNK